MLAEIAVLFAGIVGRYVFHSPLVWSDELAGILFLWLAMLGSVLAFQRDEHMRMTAIVGMLSPRAGHSWTWSLWRRLLRSCSS